MKNKGSKLMNMKEVLFVLSDRRNSSKSNQMNPFEALNSLAGDEETRLDEKSEPKLNEILPNVDKSNKKKKKKGGEKRKSAQEEEDLDKILAELGEGPDPSCTGTARTAPVPIQKDKENREPAGTQQSVGPKKKKLKKKKKKSDVTEPKEETKNGNNNLPSHAREKILDELARKRETDDREKIQEELRKREKEEREKREEEERLIREEEERKRREEEERKAKAARKAKRERKRERRLKKTQREEQNRSGSLRRQSSSRKNSPVKPDSSEKVDDVTITNSATDRVTSRSPKEKHTTKQNDKKPTELRAPICCILGHTDSGKTQLLECIKRRNVQESQAGNIIQQIGATYFPIECIKERTKELKADASFRVPGLLVIDSLGHRCFSNLRSRGSSLCDIAILVVDVVHGVENQTVESIELLVGRSIDFIVALNKIDMLDGWKKCTNAPIVEAVKNQKNCAKDRFSEKLREVIKGFKLNSINSAYYTEIYNREMEMSTIKIVPTGKNGEGIPDLLLLLVQWAQKTMAEKLTYVDEVQCTVFDVESQENHDTTIDVILANGTLHEGDQIVLCGMNGPIITNIRALLTPHPMRETHLRERFLHHRELKAAQGIKIRAPNLNHAVAGSALYVVKPGVPIETLTNLVMQEMNIIKSRVSKKDVGVYVISSSLGSLEAVTEFLRSPGVNIPIGGFAVGPVRKDHVKKARVMLKKQREFAIVIAFDVEMTSEIQKFARKSGVRVLKEDFIFRLFEQVRRYADELRNVR